MAFMSLGACFDFAIQNNIGKVYKLGDRENVYVDGAKIRKLEDEFRGRRYGLVGYDLRCEGSDSYPVLRILDQHSERLVMVNVQNETVKYLGIEKPEVIVTDCSSVIMNDDQEDIKEYELNGVIYTDIEKISDRNYLIRTSDK